MTMNNRASLMLLLMLLLSGCSTYSLEDAKDNGDVVGGPGGPLNVQRLDDFVRDIELSKEGTLRIVNFDDEGNPDIGDLTYNGSSILYRYENGEEVEAVCEGMRTEQFDRRTEYILTECDKQAGLEGPQPKEILVYIHWAD